MSLSKILLTTGWQWWCERYGDDSILCKAGNLITIDEINSRFLINPKSEEVIKTIIRRLAGLNKSKPAISAVFGEPDFLPFRFLELGLKSGAAVCRLGRKFSIESANNFVEKIYEEAERHSNVNITASTLTEILSLTHSQKEIFFGNVENNVLKKLNRKELAEKIANLKFVPAATAFLVGRNHLLTNYHVFPKKASINSEGVLELDIRFLKEYVAQFNYEQDILGREIWPVEYSVKNLLAYNNELDYALVTLEEQPESSKSYSEYVGVSGDHFGWIRMLEDPMIISPSLKKGQIPEAEIEKELLKIQEEESSILQKFLQSSNIFNLEDRKAKTIDIKVLKDVLFQRAEFGEPVNIIQHPKGRRKEIVVSNNWTLQLFDKYLWYEADADFSSSGSPVFNQQWQLVALHHGAIPPDGNEKGKQEGIRICSIIQHLRIELDRLSMMDLLSDDEISRASEIWRFLVEFVGLDKEDKGLPLPPPSYQQPAPIEQKPPTQAQAY